jgi:hypothetical protein
MNCAGEGEVAGEYNGAFQAQAPLIGQPGVEAGPGYGRDHYAHPPRSCRSSADGPKMRLLFIVRLQNTLILPIWF